MLQSLASAAPDRLFLHDREGRSLSSSAIERRSLQLLALANAAAVVLSAATAKLVYIDGWLGVSHTYSDYIVPACLLALVFHYFLKQFGLHSVASLSGPTIGFGRAWAALALAFLLLLGGMYLLKVAEAYSRGWYMLWFAFSAASIIVVRWSFSRSVKSLDKAGRLKRTIAIIGTAEYVETVRAELAKEPPCVAVTTALLPARQVGDLESDSDTILVLQAQMQAREIEQVVIALPTTDHVRIRAALRQLAPYCQEILLCTDPQSLPIPVHGTKALGGLRAEVASPVPAAEKDRLEKRVFDVVLATIGLVAIFPILLIVALAIKLDSAGPALFMQQRYGRNNRVFRILKFRTMSVAEDGDRVDQAVRNDARVTRVGRILRATSLDELPQLINVLLGDMSLVGPRPHALVHEQKFEERYDLFSLRRRVLPGMTGWAQVSGFRGETRTPESIKGRMDCDLFYIDNWSIWLDIEILARTVVTAFRGAY